MCADVADYLTLKSRVVILVLWCQLFYWRHPYILKCTLPTVAGYQRPSTANFLYLSSSALWSIVLLSIYIFSVIYTSFSFELKITCTVHVHTLNKFHWNNSYKGVNAIIPSSFFLSFHLIRFKFLSNFFSESNYSTN